MHGSSHGSSHVGSSASAAVPGDSGRVGGDRLASASQAFGSKNALGNAASSLWVTGYAIEYGQHGGNYPSA